jgi:hypothetical protein
MAALYDGECFRKVGGIGEENIILKLIRKEMN